MLWLMDRTIKRIDDTELCPCGSGLYYKDCCKNRDSQIKSSRKPPEVQIMEKMKSSMKKCCLHPDQTNCRGRIKEAHALQNNKIISLLAGTERHVYMLNTRRQPLLIPLENGEIMPVDEVVRVSANDATTETCFCDYHDNVVFAAIEESAPSFDDNNLEMKFVYAYKSFIFEYYKQRMALDIFRSCFKDNPKAFIQPDMIQIYRMLQSKMTKFENIKQRYDSEIMAGTHNGIYTCSVKLPEQIKFADFAFIAPDCDLNGTSPG